MTAAILTAARQLAEALLAEPDYAERLKAAAGVCVILSEALDDGDHGTDVSNALTEAASNAMHNARQLEQAAFDAEQERANAPRFAGLIRRNDMVLDALSTVPADLRGPEWDAAARHLVSMQARGVL